MQTLKQKCELFLLRELLDERNSWLRLREKLFNIVPKTFLSLTTNMCGTSFNWASKKSQKCLPLTFQRNISSLWSEMGRRPREQKHQIFHLAPASWLDCLQCTCLTTGPGVAILSKAWKGCLELNFPCEKNPYPFPEVNGSLTCHLYLNTSI